MEVTIRLSICLLILLCTSTYSSKYWIGFIVSGPCDQNLLHPDLTDVGSFLIDFSWFYGLTNWTT